MPDLQNFAVTRNGTVNLPAVPQWTISFRVTDSETGATLFDRTGANVLSFPQVLGQLTAKQQDDFVGMVAMWLINQRLNLGP